MDELDNFELEVQQTIESISKNIDQYEHFTLGDEEHQVHILKQPFSEGGDLAYLLISKQFGAKLIRFNNSGDLSKPQIHPLFRLYLKSEQVQADPIKIYKEKDSHLKVGEGEFPISTFNLNQTDLEWLKNKNKKEDLKTAV